MRALLTVALLAGCGSSPPPSPTVAAPAPASAPAPAPPASAPAVEPPPASTSIPVAAPEPTPPGIVAEPAKPTQTEKAMQNARARLRNCYQKELATNPGAQGAVKLSLAYDGNGKVTSSKVVCSTLPKPLTECIRKVFLDIVVEPGPGTMTFGGPC